MECQWGHWRTSAVTSGGGTIFPGRYRQPDERPTADAKRPVAYLLPTDGNLDRPEFLRAESWKRIADFP